MNRQKISSFGLVLSTVLAASCAFSTSVFAKDPPSTYIGQNDSYIYTRTAGEYGKDLFTLIPLDPNEVQLKAELPKTAQVVGVVSGVVALDPTTHSVYIINDLNPQDLVLETQWPLGIDPSPINPAASGIDPSPIKPAN